MQGEDGYWLIPLTPHPPPFLQAEYFNEAGAFINQENRGKHNDFLPWVKWEGLGIWIGFLWGKVSEKGVIGILVIMIILELKQKHVKKLCKEWMSYTLKVF